MTLEHILDTAFAFRKSKALLSAVELGLFDVLADGPQSSDDLRPISFTRRRRLGRISGNPSQPKEDEPESSGSSS